MSGQGWSRVRLSGWGWSRVVQELIRVLEVLIDPTMPARRNGMSTVLAGYKFLVRIHAKEAYEAEMTAVASAIDQTLARYWHRMARTVDTADFWSFGLGPTPPMNQVVWVVLGCLGSNWGD